MAWLSPALSGEFDRGQGAGHNPIQWRTVGNATHGDPTARAVGLERTQPVVTTEPESSVPALSASEPLPRPASRATSRIHYLDKIPVSDVPPAEIEASDFTDLVTPRRRRVQTSGPRVLIGGFALIIAIGTLLLKLPWASSNGVSITWSEALFTATSATTVTGLVVLNTANDFSLFGQIVILILLQVGGVGFISLSVLLMRLIGRRITLQTRFIVQQSVGSGELSGALRLALYVLGVTLSLEAIGALLLWLRWREHLPADEAVWYAIFHSVSAYCNAGFDLFSGTAYPAVFGFGRDWVTLGIMGTLILLGSFGITVLYDLVTATRSRSWALNTRFTLTMSLVLTTAGFALIAGDARLDDALGGIATRSEQLAVALFTTISARTAGLTVVPLSELSDASQLLLLLWMFVGGAPASMAGGVSSSTVAVILVAVLATARGSSHAVVYRRTLPAETIAKAVAIMTVSTLLVIAVTMLLAFGSDTPLFPLAFEVVSAFANTGYSLDFTAKLSEFGRYLIAFTMFWGRLGPLTIVVALAQREQVTLVRFPAEPVILG